MDVLEITNTHSTTCINVWLSDLMPPSCTKWEGGVKGGGERLPLHNDIPGRSEFGRLGFLGSVTKNLTNHSIIINKPPPSARTIRI